MAVNQTATLATKTAPLPIASLFIPDALYIFPLATRGSSRNFAMYSIGELSRKTGVKVPTIRYYEQMGLSEASARTAGNQRRYDSDDLRALFFVRHSRDLGFSIDDIRNLLTLSLHPDQPCGDAHSIAVLHLDRTRNKISKLKKLGKELERITKCKAHSIGECSVIESLADHRLCSTDHR